MAKPKRQNSDKIPKARGKHGNRGETDKGFKFSKLFHYALATACAAVAIYFGYKGYLETRVNTPYDMKKVIIVLIRVPPKLNLRNNLIIFLSFFFNLQLVNHSRAHSIDRYWGSYRSGVYFGMKARDPYSLVTGFMWYFPNALRQGEAGIRHWCEQGDNIERYQDNIHHQQFSIISISKLEFI